jgi:hypothetical protein
MSRKTKDTLTLSCVLTTEEKAVYSAQLAQAISDKKKYEGEMESFRTQNKAQITSCDTNINLLAEKVNTGREFRPVSCEIKYDFDKKAKEWIRPDT